MSQKIDPKVTEIQSKKLPKFTWDSNLVPFGFGGDNIALMLAAVFIKKAINLAKHSKMTSRYQNCNLWKLDNVELSIWNTANSENWL